MEPRPRLSMRHCQNALFKMVNDSIYFINEVKYIYSYDEENSTYFKDEAKFNFLPRRSQFHISYPQKRQGKLERFPYT